MKDNYSRFNQKVQDYIKYRPAYPPALAEVLVKALGIDHVSDKTVADIGSGTGISSKPFLAEGFRVLGVEPNEEMSAAAKTIFQNEKRFTSVKGTAEHTNLDNESVDLIFCGQAFHWFDPEKAKAEFQRIIKRNGHIVLAWNERDTTSPLQNDYEKMLYDNLEEYKTVNHKNIDEEKIKDFFSPAETTRITLDNSQYFDFDSLKGRARSSSYVPESGALFEKIMQHLKAIFDRYEQDGRIEFKYKTNIYFC